MSLKLSAPRLRGILAVRAGAVAACAMPFCWFAFGTGLGLSVVSLWTGSGVSTRIAMKCSSIGSYLPGRLRSEWDGVHGDEVYFRDTAHGFVAWALASVLDAVVLVSPRRTSGVAPRQA